MKQIYAPAHEPTPVLPRRDILKSGAGPFFIAATGAAQVADAQGADALADAAAWVQIAPAGAIRILFPATKMRQGSSTGLSMTLAEELDANWDDVVVAQQDANDRRFGNPAFGHGLYTASSSAVYRHRDVLRQAGPGIGVSVEGETLKALHRHDHRHEIALRAAYIANAEARFMTGANIPADGSFLT